MKKRILYIAHNYHNKAGVEGHIRTLEKQLDDVCDVYICFPVQNRVILLHKGKIILNLDGEQLSILPPLASENMNSALSKIVETVTPDVLHLMHWVNWPLNTIEQLGEFNIPLVVSFHDYYFLTPIWTMQGEDCPEKLLSAEYAITCFGKDISDYLHGRRALFVNSMQKVAQVIVPSPFLAKTLAPFISNNLSIVPYGIEPFEPHIRTESQHLRFGYFGSLIPQKGWDRLLLAFSTLVAKHQNVELHYFGGTQQACDQVPHVYCHGVFEGSDLPRISAAVDVGIIPSLFAETYCIMLSELWQGGLPTAVSDIGALGERVTDGVNGKKFKPGDVEDMTRTLEWFIENDTWQTWQLPTPYYAEEMKTTFLKLYDSM